MKRFLLKIVLVPIITAILVIIIISASSAIVKNRSFRNWETESNTLMIQENTQYDLCILGISHARNFSRHNNHNRIEEILNKKILNLGQGRGKCGVNEQLFYLQYAYSKDIKIDTLLYVFSPPMVFGDYLNQASHTFELETFDWDFFNQYLKFEGDNKRERIFSYIKYKLHPEWIFKRPHSTENKQEFLTKLDSTVVLSGFEAAYKDTNLTLSFQKNIPVIKKTIELASSNNTHVMLFVPPALFGEWPKHNEVVSLMNQLKDEYGISIADYSGSIKDPKLYYDHHHLNTEGVVEFSEEYLREFLK